MSFSLSTTLYAFTNEWLSRRYSFEQLVRRSSELGLGPGLEVIGYQSIRGYPRIDAELERSFKTLVHDLGLEPSCLGANIDVARRPDRMMTPDEVKEALAAQVEAARILGFPTIRAQKIGEQEFEWAARVAERAGVRLGIEVHAPLFVDSPLITSLRETFERIDSPYLGFIPDWSATMTALPVGRLRSFEADGLTRAQTEHLRALWEGGGPPLELFDEFAERARSEGASEAAIQQVRTVFTMFARNDPRGWRELMPRVVHVHAKFYELEPDGADLSIPHAELVRVLLESGYDGYVSSEWEGHAWVDLDDADAFELVRRHQELYRRLIQSVEAPA